MATVRSVATRAVTTAISGGNINITKPTGLTAGDLLFAIIGYNGGTPSTPSGWTLYSDANMDSVWRVYYKTASSGDAAASSFDFPSTGSQGGGVLYALTSFHPTPDLRVNGNAGAGNQTSVSISLSLTPLATQSLAIIVGFCDDAGSDADPSAYGITGGTSPTFTERIQSTDTTDHEVWFVADATYADSTTITAVTWTDAASIDIQKAQIILIAPQRNGAGTSALLTPNTAFHAPVGGAGTNGTAALTTTGPEFAAPSGDASVPTVWTTYTKS